MAIALALIPIVILIGLLAGARWSAVSAGLASASAAAAVAAFGFGYGADGADWVGALLEAGFTAATILWIIFGALCIHEYQTRSGAISIFARWLASLGEDRRITALFVAWFFALFLEGAAGFGTPVALAAPLLVGLGFSPLRALTLVLLGHAVGVSFGAIGTPVVPLGLAAPASAQAVSLGIALVQAALGWSLAILIFRLADPDAKGGWIWPILAAFAFFLPYVLLAAFIGPELPTLGGALAGSLAFAFLVRRRQSHVPTAITPRELLASAFPYLVVIAIVLLTRLLPSLQEMFAGATIGWTYAGRFSGSVSPLYHPGTILIAAFLITGIVHRGRFAAAAGRAAARLPMVAVALFAVLALARLMAHSGMTELLAAAIAEAMGSAFPLAAPAVGALGSFMVGSATGSNILFAEFQVDAAAAAGLSPALTLAGQGVGAAIGNVITPHNIVAGAATVGLIGGEGRVLRQTLPVCLAYVAAGGALLFATSILTGGGHVH
jgi:lactate permease